MGSVLSSEGLSGNGHPGKVMGATLTQGRFGRPDRAYSFNGADVDLALESPGRSVAMA